MRSRTIAGALALALCALASLPAAAQPALPAPDPQGEAPPAAPAPAAARRQYLSLGLGLRAAAVESEGLDPFSEDNAIPMLTLFGTVTPWATRPFSVHLAFEWDYGGTSARARGLASSMEVHRLAVGLELRYLPVSRISLFVRGMPAAIHLGGRIADASFVDHLEANAWTWGVDATAGAAARIAAFGDAEHPAASMWIGLDMGYRFAGSAAMRLRPGGLSDADRGRRFGELPMADLDLSGFVGRLTGSVSF